MKHENLPINAKIFLGARRLIKQGWVKGMAQAGDSVCLTQALWLACREYPGKLNEVCATVCGLIGTGQIPSWNDCAWRTQEEVLGVLDEAISMEMSVAPPRYSQAEVDAALKGQGLNEAAVIKACIDDHFFDELEKIGG